MKIGDHISPSVDNCADCFNVFFRWKKSLYSLIWKHVLIYFTLYISLTLIYDFALDGNGKSEFDALARYCSKYTGSIPVILLLGFFTSTAMQRWFSTMAQMPGIAKNATVFTMSLKEDLPEGLILVQQYSRWLLLSWTLTFRMVCQPMRRTFPDMASLQRAGLLLEHERILLEEEAFHNSHEEILPLLVLDWIMLLLKKINREGKFVHLIDYNRNIDAVVMFKKNCGSILKFSSKNIPFSLIQAVSVAVYSFGLASLMSRKFNEENRTTSIISGYCPLLHSISYFIFFAWLKFGRVAANPFGDDDEDIDINKLFQLHQQDAIRIASLYTGEAEQLVQLSLQMNSTESLTKSTSVDVIPQGDISVATENYAN